MGKFLKLLYDGLIDAKWYYWLFVISHLILLSALISCEYYVEGCRCSLQKKLACFGEQIFFNDLLVVVATVSGTILGLVVTLAVTILGNQIKEYAPAINTSEILSSNIHYQTIKWSFFAAIATSTIALLVRGITFWLVLLLVISSVVLFFIGLLHFCKFIAFVVNVSANTSNTLLSFFQEKAKQTLDEKD